MAIINCKIGQNSSYFKVYIEYSYTQNIKANTSTITAALKLQQLTDSYDFDTVSAVKVGFTMVGEEFSKTQRININDKGNTGYTITLASGTKTVTHNSSGKKTITFSCNNTSSLLNCSGYGPGNITLSSTSVTLKQIPRNSTLDKVTSTSETTAISSLSVDNGVRVWYTPTVSTYYHRLVFYVGSTKKKTVNLGKASSTSQKYYTLSSVPASWLPSSASGTLKCYLYTYSDSAYETKIGSADSESITIKVPNDDKYNPKISLATTYTYNNKLNVCLKGISKATFKITGTAGSGASISSYSLSGPGVSSTSASATVTFNTYNKTKETNGLTYTATVTDSRGRTKTTSETIIVYNYAKPVILSGSVSRNASTQTRVNGKVNASVSTIGGKNSISTIYWYYRLLGASDWIKVSSASISNNTPTTSPTTIVFNAYKTYQFRFKVTDAAGKYTYSKTYTISTSVVPINIAKNNNGVAIGGMSTVTSSTADSKFECNWKSYFKQNLYLNDASGDQQSIRFCDGSKSKWETSLYKGNSTSTTVIGIYDVTNSRSVWKYLNDGTFNFYRPVCIANDYSYRAYKSDGITDLNLIKLSDKNNVVIGTTVNNDGTTNDDGSINNKGNGAVYIGGVTRNTTSYAANMRIGPSSHQIYMSSASSQRYKTDIHPIQLDALSPDKLYDLPVREFKYREGYLSDEDRLVDVSLPGFIAEEVDEFYPIACEYDESDRPENWNIRIMVPPMLKLIQEQHEEIELLKLRVEQQQKEIEALRTEVDNMKNK